jgi:hypothetical protein
MVMAKKGPRDKARRKVDLDARMEMSYQVQDSLRTNNRLILDAQSSW